MGVAKDWVEANFPSIEGSQKAMLILAYGTGLDAGLAEAQDLVKQVAENWLGENRGQAFDRRLNALEIHIQDLEERFQPINRYIGQTAREAFADGNAGNG